MASLESGFERKLGRAVTPDRQQTEEIGERMKEIAEANWRAYAKANGYDIEHIWQDVEMEIVTAPEESRIKIKWPFSALFEFGVDPHVIQASSADMLKFPWPDGPDEVLDQFRPMWDDPSHFLEEPEVLFPAVNWGSESGGIPRARAVRDMLREIRSELS